MCRILSAHYFYNYYFSYSLCYHNVIVVEFLILLRKLIKSCIYDNCVPIRVYKDLNHVYVDLSRRMAGWISMSFNFSIKLKINTRVDRKGQRAQRGQV